MKILFVLENLSDRCGANVNIALKIAQFLSKDNDIYALSKYSKARPIVQENPFLSIFSFFDSQYYWNSKFMVEKHWNDISFFKKCVLMFLNIKFLLCRFDIKYNDSYFTRKLYSSKLEFLCETRKFDIVIGVSAPFYISRAIADAKIDCFKSIILLDPYSYNYETKKWFIPFKRKIESRVIDDMNLVFSVSFVYDEIIRRNIVRNTNKIIRFQLCGISEKLQPSDVCHHKSAEINNDDTVKFLFSGRFYEKIRTPDFLIKLFSLLPNNYELHIVGGGIPKNKLEKFKRQLGKKLHIHGWLSSVRTKKEILSTNILINVNNSIYNQLPSKLFEYISTGKPILNICKSHRCLSLPYTEKYSNCVNIYESDFLSNSVSKTIEFVSTNKNKRIPFKNILDTFAENTDIYLSKLISKELISKYSHIRTSQYDQK